MIKIIIIYLKFLFKYFLKYTLRFEINTCKNKFIINKNNYFLTKNFTKMTTLDINKATQPFEYYLKFIRQNCRPDCRKLSDIRPCNISFNCIETVNGSAMVKLGATNVICGISTRVCKPRVEMPNKGIHV